MWQVTGSVGLSTMKMNAPETIPGECEIMEIMPDYINYIFWKLPAVTDAWLYIYTFFPLSPVTGKPSNKFY